MSEEEQDMISSLPDAILIEIISCLPTKHSIQSSILSKRWINLWKFTPSIDIQLSHPHNEEDTTPCESSIIHSILSQHQAMKLHKFSLHISDESVFHLTFEVQRCIEFVISRQVQILSLSAKLVPFHLEEYYVLPNMFYSHDNVPSLEHISLKGLFLDPNPASTLLLPFASLKTLCLFDCTIVDETLKALLSNCPVLESLTIDMCLELLSFKASWCQSMRLKHLIIRCTYGDHFPNLEIDVSSLSTIKVYGMKVSFTSLSAIVDATVFQSSYYPYQQDLGRNLAHVTKLGVDSWFSEFLAVERKANGNGWKIFENLKVFSWFGSIKKECDLIALVAFLSHCPLLETINLDLRDNYWEEETSESSRPRVTANYFTELGNGDYEQQVVTIGYLHNVKKIMVHHFFGNKSEMEFIKHLLQKSIVLETLCLTYHRLEYDPETLPAITRYNGRPKESVEEEIYSFPIASSSLVHILFHHTYHMIN